MKIFLDNEDLGGRYSKFDEPFFLSITDKISLYAIFEPEAELSLVLTDDNNIAAMNMQYRKKKSAADVLSFPLEEDFMLGDIVISMDTADRQAKDAGIALDIEVAFLFIHGFLHLLGYDHETDEQEASKMYDLQEQILREWTVVSYADT